VRSETDFLKILDFDESSKLETSKNIFIKKISGKSKIHLKPQFKRCEMDLSGVEGKNILEGLKA
jgi:hypothetical protein